MVRTVAAVIIGYVIMALVLVGGLGLAWFALGNERSYEPGGWDVTPLFAGVVLAASFIAAIVGGMVCRVIARRPTPVLMLAGIILLLGTVTAAGTQSRQADRANDPSWSDVRPDGPIPMDAAMNNARQPIWSLWGTPIVGLLGTLLGGSLIGRGARPE